jgi:hypothetical protein
MSFQRPELLWLLLALLVPLVLYVLPLPRRRVMSTALFLWERFLQSEMLGRTSERFRRALGLALLAAILAALVAAAAELSVGKPAVDARRLVVLIDASASMNARGPAVMADSDETPASERGASNLELAKRAAVDVVASLGTGTEVAVAEAAGRLQLISAFQPAGRAAVDAVAGIEPFDGPTDLPRLLDEAFDSWGDDEDCEMYVFTDAPVSECHWGRRARVWIAPSAGDNAAIVALEAHRRGKTITARFTLANYGRAPQALTGTILVNEVPRSTFQGIVVGPGETSPQQATIEEPGAATLSIRLDIPSDALAADNEAWLCVPVLEDFRARVAWPPGGKHNAYVSAVLSSLQDQGTIGEVGQAFQPDATSRQVRLESLTYGGPLTVFVNQAPEAWPEGGAIVLHPLSVTAWSDAGPRNKVGWDSVPTRSGQSPNLQDADAIGISGLHPAPVTITRQAQHPLLDGVELRGLVVEDVVQLKPPSWAEPIVWAGDLPVVWAGENGRTRALIVALPLTTDDSRLPLLASFPVLMGNA